MSTDDEFCPGCGQINDERVTERLWGIYERLDDGRQHREGLSFDGEWLREHIVDDEDHAVLMHTMERDMAQRGLCARCGSCGRPDLRGIDPASVLDRTLTEVSLSNIELAGTIRLMKEQRREESEIFVATNEMLGAAEARAEAAEKERDEARLDLTVWKGVYDRSVKDRLALIAHGEEAKAEVARLKARLHELGEGS